MKFSLCLIGLVFLSGCITRPEPNPVFWDLSLSEAEIQAPAAEKKADWASVRITGLEIRPPCDRVNLCIRRANGTWAFDPLNLFADAPQSLLRTLSEDAFRASGRFGAVVPGASSLAAATEAEIDVENFSLAVDAASGVRSAQAAVAVRLLRGREIVATARGEGTAAATDGNYAHAFSSAYAEALLEAVNAL